MNISSVERDTRGATALTQETHRSNTLILEHGAAMILLLLVLSFFYRDIVFTQRTFLQLGYTAGTMPMSAGGGAYGYPGKNDELRSPPVDSAANGWVNEPYTKVGGAILAGGEVPLWNPMMGMGEPLLADGNSAPLEPLQLLLYLVPDPYWPLAVDVQVLLRYFLAGLFTYLFARSLGLSLLPAIYAGIAFMLSSYLVAFGNHPQLRAEALLPLALYSYDRLARRVVWEHILLVALVITWVIVASFPQSGFLVLVFSSCWYIYRSWWLAKDALFDRRRIWRLALAFVLAVTLGLGLSAFFYLPLVEHILGSMHIHDRGVGMLAHPYPHAVVSILTGYPTNFYIINLLLATIGLVVGSLFDSRRRLVWFFAAGAIVFYLKIYGFVVVQWIALLPGFDQLLLRKYLVPFVSLCFALLSAFGIESIVKRAVSYRFVLYICIAAGIVFICIVTRPYVDTITLDNSLYLAVAMLVALCTIIGVTRSVSFNQMYSAAMLVLLLVAEIAIWHKDIVRPLRYDPYTPAPFITFLREQREEYRIFGFDRILQTAIAAGYGINDIRFIAALVPQDRYLYINQFLTSGGYIAQELMRPGEFFSKQIPKRVSPILLDPSSPHIVELVDTIKFQGTENPLYLGKFFDLLNARYILAPTGRPLADRVAVATLPGAAAALQRQGAVVEGVSVAGEVRQGFVVRASSPITVPLFVPAGYASLEVGLGIDPNTLAGLRGDERLMYAINVTDGRGEQRVLDYTLDLSQGLPAGWVDRTIDLSPWSGQRVTLTFALSVPSLPKEAQPASYWSVPVLKVPTPTNFWANQYLQSVDSLDLSVPLVSHNVTKEGFALGTSVITINKDQRTTLFLLPDNAATLDVHLPQATVQLTFAIALDPAVWANNSPGDGVRYRVLVRTSVGETEVFSRFIDPKHNQDERRWIDVAIDLSQWGGQQVTLVFATDRGPAGDGRDDLAHWSKIQLGGKGIGALNAEFAHFQLVYDGEIQIYRNAFAYPRAFVVHNVAVVADADAAIRKLARPGFDPSIDAVVEASPHVGSLAPINREAVLIPPTAAQVVQQTANTKQIITRLQQPGLLVLSETYSNGWKASVDGVPTPLHKVNLFMQGVYLPPGDHVVHLVYAPTSFAIGSAISMSTLAAIVIGWIARIMMRRRALRRAV